MPERAALHLTGSDRFVTRRRVLEHGADRLYDPRDWHDSLVLVEQGVIELESVHGVRRRFGTGAILFLSALHLKLIRSCGRKPAVLTVARRRTEQFRANPGLN